MLEAGLLFSDLLKTEIKRKADEKYRVSGSELLFHMDFYFFATINQIVW